MLLRVSEAWISKFQFRYDVFNFNFNDVDLRAPKANI